MKTLILIIGILAVVACGVVAFIFLRRSNRENVPASNPSTAKLQQSPKPKKHWAVYVIDHPANADICDAVRKLQFRHFGQSQQLPLLPLKDCNKKDTCQCFHREMMEKRRAQRRVGRDRREEFRFEQGKAAKPERRKLRDRRADARWEGYDTDR